MKKAPFQVVFNSKDVIRTYNLREKYISWLESPFLSIGKRENYWRENAN
jgi:hypothetical protein